MCFSRNRGKEGLMEDKKYTLSVEHNLALPSADADRLIDPAALSERTPVPAKPPPDRALDPAAAKPLVSPPGWPLLR